MPNLLTDAQIADIIIQLDNHVDLAKIAKEIGIAKWMIKNELEERDFSSHLQQKKHKSSPIKITDDIIEEMIAIENNGGSDMEFLEYMKVRYAGAHRPSSSQILKVWGNRGRVFKSYYLRKQEESATPTPVPNTLSLEPSGISPSSENTDLLKGILAELKYITATIKANTGNQLPEPRRMPSVMKVGTRIKTEPISP